MVASRRWSGVRVGEGEGKLRCVENQREVKKCQSFGGKQVWRLSAIRCALAVWRSGGQAFWRQILSPNHSSNSAQKSYFTEIEFVLGEPTDRRSDGYTLL